MSNKKTFFKNILLIKALFLVSFIFMLSFTFAQESKLNFYQHMKGIINNDIQIIADISFNDNNINGYYYYFFDNHEGNKNNVYHGKTIPLHGKINILNEIVIYEFNNEGAKFTGILKNNNKIEGHWQRHEDEKKLDFHLNEYYPDGSIKFKMYNLESSCPLIKSKENSSFANIKIMFLYPVSDTSSAISNILLKEFFGEKMILQHPDIMMVNFEQEYFSNYKTANKDINIEQGSLNWNKKKRMDIHYNENYILSVSFTNYAHTGGSHGLKMKKFLILDLKKNKKIEIKNIFKDNYQTEIIKIINKKIRDKYEIKNDEKLSNNGFFYDKIPISNNYYISKDGITFYYNHYEIASYATGYTEIFIPYKNIMHLIKINSPVNRILNSLY